ncbi:LuxR C-terminal-related transcriptional regulator [Lelliottia nimipressuralis]|uniref:HTH luxR-type domain-containing protein n=1 Tax=Lelliottia nimipressuralis TaxID=69220 RepID=A0ABY3NXL6_9ENTR|nr:LuxR C-terminal-related transcriptional regulator [Lelliottia nimipressuralis]RXJ10770.1 hypothetical protein ETG88_19765 [Lelliottia nimipressuralis]TYT29271.1 hypothetical protein FZO59_21045 [Lelliottia nimipressuralis]
MIIISTDSFLKKGIEELYQGFKAKDLIIFDICGRLYFLDRKMIKTGPVYRNYLHFNHFSIKKSSCLSSLKRVIKGKQWKSAYHQRIKITEREQEVIKLMAQGYNQRKISIILNLGEKAISYYKINALRKKKVKGMPFMILAMNEWDEMMATLKKNHHDMEF